MSVGLPSVGGLTNSSRKYEVSEAIEKSLDNCLSETDLLRTVPQLKSKIRGKDIYDGGDYLVLVTTDRQSAFDRILASIPFKGQLEDMLPEGTDTSLWTVYKNGSRNYVAMRLPDGMVKNEKLSANILTPTTKAADHDVPVTPKEIIEQGLMSPEDYEEVSRKALSLFEFGLHVASEHGLILVDTKYEFGKAPDGTILLIDEVHTPDSSRYWIADSYEERFQKGLEPENVDKEFLRLWFKENLQSLTTWLFKPLCRYIFLYETITKTKFELPILEEPIHDRISRNVLSALSSL
ncbi:unnamed protein product [Rhodiola kirilowii]